jgi:hypothetical protein
MGFNSTLLILNDALDLIEKDPEFGKKVAQAIQEFGCYGKERKDIGVSGHGNAASVIDCHHADTSTLILVGGNYGTVVQPAACGWDHDKGKEEALRRWADKAGYRLVKKSKKK